MVTRIRIEPLSEWLSVAADEMLSPAAQQRAVAEFARDQLGEAQKANRAALGKEPAYDQIVDGRLGVPLESVKVHGGKITFEFDLASDTILAIWDMLAAASPVVSGEYRRSHRLFADSKEVLRGEPVPEAGEYVFVNTTPYSRRLEIGKTESGRPFVVQVPPLIYQRVARAASGRFGNLVSVKSKFMTPPGAYALRNDQRTRDWSEATRKWRFRPGQRADRVRGSQVTTPAIIVTMR